MIIFDLRIRVWSKFTYLSEKQKIFCNLPRKNKNFVFKTKKRNCSKVFGIILGPWMKKSKDEKIL